MTYFRSARRAGLGTMFSFITGLVFFIVSSRAAESTANGIEQGSWAPFVEPNFPFFSAVLDARKLGPGWPVDNLTPRGLVLNLENGCWACFDTDLLRMSVIWTGNAITPVSMSQISYHSAGSKAKEGEEILPQIIGSSWIANGIYPGWQTGAGISLSDPREAGPSENEIGRGPLSPLIGRFRRIRLKRDGPCLEYNVAESLVREWVAARIIQGEPVVQRRFRLEHVPRQFWLVLGRSSSEVGGGLKFSIATQNRLDGGPAAELSLEPDDLHVVRVPASDSPVEFSVAMGIRPSLQTWDVAHTNDAVTAPAPRRWPQKVTTRGILSKASDAFVVDNIALPTENPWRRNVRFADIAFFPDGRAGAVTFDGDVWMISGLDGDLAKVQWERFASGLHEPLGLCVRDEELFVFDRNGIWRLRDTDGNGEADVYELFSNAFTQTAETREYAQGIRVAPDGSFIIAKGGIQMTLLGKHNGSVLRVSPDGNSTEVLGYGLRSPFIGVHPKTGLITASDQQGNYVPTTPLHVIRDGQFYGFLSNLLPKEQYPASIADPLTWIPYPINPSGAGQVWLVGARMGSLNDALIHIGYYRPEIFAVRLNDRASRPQAAIVSVTRDLEFAPLNGAVNPTDGQLYVIGFQSWGTVARQISGLARLSYTGAPSTLPREVVPMDKGILLRFDVLLDPKMAADPANFSAERWEYKRTAAYGSPHFKPDGSKGQEAMVPSSAYLSRDGKSVFVAIPDMKPVMQMRVGWSLATKGGARFDQNTYFTPYELIRFEPSAEGFETLTVNLTPRSRQAVPTTPVTIEEGKRVAELMGCVACHSTDGSTLGKVGPTWKGLFGSEVALADGTSTRADEPYLRESIKEPVAKVVRGFDKSDTSMPSYEGLLSDLQIEAMIRYLESLR